MLVATATPAPASDSPRFLDAEQPTLLHALRRSSLRSDYLYWEEVRAQLIELGYRVAIVRSVEHLLPLGG